MPKSNVNPKPTLNYMHRLKVVTLTYLHANLHVGEISERYFSGNQLPEQHSEAPHVCRTPVNFLWLLLQS